MEEPPALKKSLCFVIVTKYVSLCREAGAHLFPYITLVNVKSTGGYLQWLGAGFFRTGAGHNAIPTDMIKFV